VAALVDLVPVYERASVGATAKPVSTPNANITVIADCSDRLAMAFTPTRHIREPMKNSQPHW
jgi:hypothetical protein